MPDAVLAFVDRGYKGHGVSQERCRVLISGTRKLGFALKRHLRRRSAVEPEIGHMKNDGLLGRNVLKGMKGDAMNAFLSGAGHNLRKILARLRSGMYGWLLASIKPASWNPPPGFPWGDSGVFRRLEAIRGAPETHGAFRRPVIVGGVFQGRFITQNYLQSKRRRAKMPTGDPYDPKNRFNR